MKSQSDGSDLWSSTRTAFSNWKAVVAILGVVASLFNATQTIAHIGLSKAFAIVFGAYDKAIHAPPTALASAFHLPPPAPIAIDLCLAWLILGGVVARTLWTLRIAAAQGNFIFWGRVGPLLGFFESPRQPILRTLCGAAIWPLALIPIFLRSDVGTIAEEKRAMPFAIRAGRRKTPAFAKGIDAFIGEHPAHLQYRFIADLRVVLLLQLVAAIVLLGALLVGNSLLKN